MFSKPKPVTSDKQSTVFAYKYEALSFNGRHFDSITEYFIPSHQVCFNEQAAFSSTEARNSVTSFYDQLKGKKELSPLIEVQLSKTLVDEIVKGVKLKDIISLQKTKEFEELFAPPKKLSKLGK
ncbi:MAG: hypothetical protein A3F13_05320 [Gammaproteobacteria bacterium RIFCSPHIGHO2_12_FULL_40_19]|nr:MAG: hypothetical protein A3F13_05320 [Gammaproteobacteria bacterium RIFCSPHIGHO2_12_FULL_40_19]